MPYATHTYGSTEYAGSLGAGAAGSSPAGTEYHIPADDRTVVLRVQADPMVPYENREVKVPSVSVDPVTFIKDPTAVKDYSFDWAEILEAGETIATSAWGGGLAAAGDYILGDKTFAFLSGGTSGTMYVVDCAIVTSLGREYTRQFRVSVQET